MKRQTFLRTLLTTSLAAAISPRLLAAPAPQRKFIYSQYVAGYQFHAGPEVEHLMQPGHEVQLVRQPKHEQDPRAIALYWRNRQIGYIPCRHNRVLANMLDEEVPLYAEIAKVNLENEMWKRIQIGILIHN